MRIRVSVKPQSKRDSLKRISDDEYLVELKAPARKGKANTALVKLLSKHFGRNVRIVSGLTSRDKMVEIEDAATSFET